MTTRRIVVALGLTLTGWLTIMALVMRFSDAAPAAVVPFPSERLVAGLPEETGILGLDRCALTVANAPGTAAALDEAGAWIVLPAGLKGCLPLSKEKRARMAPFSAAPALGVSENDRI